MKARSTAVTGGLLFSLLLFFTAAASTTHDAGAQSPGVQVSSTGFDRTAIIELENRSDLDISEIRIWLPSGVGIVSFKSEEGWTGKKNSVEVLVFTTGTALKPGEAVKIGLKADRAKPNINWRALDASGVQVGIGVSQPEDLGGPADDVQVKNNTTPVQTRTGAILDSSTFRLIPDKPKVGDTVRVVGTGFAPGKALSFYIDGGEAAALETNDQGGFVLTSQIPETLSPSRVDFAVRDSDGKERTVSLRVGEKDNRGEITESIPLTVGGLSELIHRGDIFRISGRADPGGTVAAQILGPEGGTVTSEPRSVDASGRWVFETLIQQDAVFGEYRVIITDGISTIERTWRVESSKTIEIEPVTLKFEPGDAMVFNGTAKPNQPIEFVLENPQGAEVAADTKNTDDVGFVEFSYQTEQSSPEGTYVLTAKQGDSTETIVTGLGELPKENIFVKLDKTNYKKSEDAIVIIDGPSSAVLSLIVVDPSDVPRFTDNRVILQPDGKLEYVLDLDEYKSGEYTLILKRANSKTSEVFTVGLEYGTTEIRLTTTKDVYETGDSILILGEAKSNVLILLELIDPDGNVVKEKETFTKKDGRLTEDSFRIPSDAKAGVWKVKASSGPIFETTDLEVVATIQEGMLITIDGMDNFPEPIGDVVKFHVFGARNNVEITVYDEAGGVIGKKLRVVASDEGEIPHFWEIPEALLPGTYNMTAVDAFDSASVLFAIE